MSRLTPLSRLLAEARERNVPRVLLGYLIAAWVAVQVAETTFPYLNLPSWGITLVIVLALAGLPIVLFLAWVFERTAEGLRRTPSPSGRISPTPRRGYRFPRLTAAGLGILLMVGAGSWALRVRPETRPATANATLAVLPFAVQASPGLAYLREGLATLLARKLDGVGQLRTVDPRAVLGVSEYEEARAPDAVGGRGLAKRLQAGLYLTGEVVEVGQVLHISAALHPSEGGTPLAQASVEGAADSLSSLVDELAVQIIGTIPDLAGSRLTRLATLTSPSLAAVRAYLEGENFLRTGHPDSAVAAFERAVAFDTAFALGHYRLGVAAMAAGWVDRVAFARAAAAADRLADRDRQVIEAVNAWQRTDLEAAERLYRRLLLRYPDDVEAWFWLGELLFHNGPPRGRSLAESVEPWLRVLEYEPSNVSALMHLSRVAAATEDRGLMERVVAHLPAHDGAEDRRLTEVFLHEWLLSAAPPPQAQPGGTGQTTGGAQIADRLKLLSDDRITATAIAAASFSRNLVDLATALDTLVPLMSGNSRATALLIAAQVELARGRTAAAMAKFDQADERLPHRTSLLRAFAALAPFSGVSKAERAAARARLERQDAPGPDDPVPALWPIMREYVLGLLALRDGDVDRAERHFMRLEGWGGEPTAVEYARSRSLTLAAHIAHAAGRSVEALESLEAIEYPLAQFRALASPLEAPDRWLRAELLAETGRTEEAIRWYDVIAQARPEEIPFLAPAHYRRAQLQEQLGRKGAAALHYSRFIEMWRNSDPEMQHLPEAAQARLLALRSAAD